MKDTGFRKRCKWETYIFDRKCLGANCAASTTQIDAEKLQNSSLADPVITDRTPNISLDWKIGHISEDYHPSYGASVSKVYGERVTFTLRRGSEVLDTQNWSSEFPTGTVTDFIFPKIDVSKLTERLLSRKNYQEGALAKLSQSKVPEVRAAATKRLDALRAGKP